MAKHNAVPAVPEPVLPPGDLIGNDLDLTPSEAATELNHASHSGDKAKASAAASILAYARWATEAEYDTEVREFFSTIDIEEGFVLLAKMRARCELAARTIEIRRTQETLDTACLMCHTTKRQLGNRNWRMVRPRKDSATGAFITEYFCSDACIVEENRRKHGIAAMTDRGMLPGDAPATQKSKQQIYQENVKRDAEFAASTGGKQKGK